LIMTYAAIPTYAETRIFPIGGMGIPYHKM